MDTTIHFDTDRQDRIDKISDLIGFGHVVRSFDYDRGHPNGPEIHTLTSTGIVIVRNARTKKIVTVLIARPGQIARLYKLVNEDPPKELMDIARQHMEAGYNML